MDWGVTIKAGIAAVASFLKEFAPPFLAFLLGMDKGRADSAEKILKDMADELHKENEELRTLAGTSDDDLADRLFDRADRKDAEREN